MSSYQVSSEIYDGFFYPGITLTLLALTIFPAWVRIYLITSEGSLFGDHHDNTDPFPRALHHFSQNTKWRQWE